MSPDDAIELIRQTVLTSALIAAPLLAIVCLSSFLVAVMQSMTSVQDPTVSLTPKLLIGGVALLCLLPWMLDRLTDFSTDIYRGIASGF